MAVKAAQACGSDEIAPSILEEYTILQIYNAVVDCKGILETVLAVADVKKSAEPRPDNTDMPSIAYTPLESPSTDQMQQSRYAMRIVAEILNL